MIVANKQINFRNIGSKKKMSNDGLFQLVGLFSAIANGPSNVGNRSDGKICVAQAGECRYNHRYYSPGMRDSKSWSMPCADDSCSDRCGYLQDKARNMGTQDERYERVGNMIDTLGKKQESDRLSAMLLIGSLGIDPREVIE